MKTKSLKTLKKIGVVLFVCVLSCIVMLVCNTTKSFADDVVDTDEQITDEQKMLGDDLSSVAERDELYNQDLNNLVTLGDWREEKEIKNHLYPHVFQTNKGVFHEVLGFKYNMRGYIGQGAYGKGGDPYANTARTADVQFFYNTERHNLLVLALRFKGEYLDTRYWVHEYDSSVGNFLQFEYITNFGKVQISTECKDIFLDNRLTILEKGCFYNFFALNRVCWSEVDTNHRFVCLNTRNVGKLEKLCTICFNRGGNDCPDGLKLVIDKDWLDVSSSAFDGCNKKDFVGIWNLSGHCHDIEGCSLEGTLVQAIERDGTIIGTALTDPNGLYQLRICKGSFIKLKFINKQYGIEYTTEEFCMNDNRGYDYELITSEIEGKITYDLPGGGKRPVKSGDIYFLGDNGIRYDGSFNQDDGSYIIKRIPRGITGAVYYSAQEAQEHSGSFKLDKQAKSISLTVHLEYLISGICKDKDGNTLSNSVIELLDNNGDVVYRTLADWDGRYVINQLDAPTGRFYKIRATYPNDYTRTSTTDTFLFDGLMTFDCIL